MKQFIRPVVVIVLLALFVTVLTAPLAFAAPAGQTPASSPTAEQIAAVIAALLIPFLAAWIKASGTGDPTKSYIELALSVVIAYIALVVTGTLPIVPAPGSDPVLWVTTLGQFVGVIFTLAFVVYNVFQQQIQSVGHRLAGK